MIAENVRDEQRKVIKYNHLVANLLSFHTLVTMTRPLQQLLEEGRPVDMDALSSLSPYRTEQINRLSEHLPYRSRDLRVQQITAPATTSSATGASMTYPNPDSHLIHWPEGYDPAHASVYISNFIDISASAETVWAWLIRAKLWPSWYSNSRAVRIENPRFRWWTFGVTI